MRDEVSWLYKEAAARGLIVGSSGNVSARTPDGMVITPSGGDPETVTAAELAAVTLDGVALNAATPSSEWAMHAAVYRVCPEAAFVVHTHADACTALACLNQALPAFHYMVVQFGGVDVRCAPYVTFGTPALAEHAAEAIRGRSACLLANHGMIVSAGTAAAALSRAVLLETLCRQYLLALSAGKPRLLTAQEMLDAQERFKTYGPRSGT
ncbi:MAG: class II aldolase/adducin family protein [Rhodopila sp.]|nr:class II aldolase/adducin family protein [Rhodopila sp.]